MRKNTNVFKHYYHFIKPFWSEKKTNFKTRKAIKICSTFLLSPYIIYQHKTLSKPLQMEGDLQSFVKSTGFVNIFQKATKQLTEYLKTTVPLSILQIWRPINQCK